MDEEELVGCICCMSATDLCDLFVCYANNDQTYCQMLETCFELKVTNDFKYICANCVEKLDRAYTLKLQTVKNIDMLQSIKDEEYLDEAILEDESQDKSQKDVSRDKSEKVLIIRKPDKEEHRGEDDDDELDEEHEIEALDETTCIYCNLQLDSVEGIHHHIRIVHGLEPRTGRKVRECNLCGASLRDLADHFKRCHNSNFESEGRQYACHFCDNVYNSKKACFTHLRMKHGLKLCNDHTPKYSSHDRKKCHICSRDFSQKQILNNHLWKAHGFEVEKRKAFFCPLCSERVSYGANFSAHLSQNHHVTEEIEQLEFSTMDVPDISNALQQSWSPERLSSLSCDRDDDVNESATKSEKGKGKRPAPERQIYKTGKACPAHMIVTETLDKVLVTFYKTHVGHGTCPYYEPREPKRPKSEENDETLLVCDTCGARVPPDKIHAHVSSHGNRMFPCEYCSQQSWSPERLSSLSCDRDDDVNKSATKSEKGKGKRPAPERQIYKTGKACPAHMIVTETLDKVLVTFYKTHVGHGTCPYYEPREPKRPKSEENDETLLVCDTCGARVPPDKIHAHVSSHGNRMFPCEYCSQLFQSIEEWTVHIRTEHQASELL